jgi:hypothetical protein
MNDALVGVIRTAVTTGVGAFFAWLLTHNIAIDLESQKALTVGLTALVIAAYYFIVRLLEPHLPTWLRVILAGVPRTPSYSKPFVGETDGTERGFAEPSPN